MEWIMSNPGGFIAGEQIPLFPLEPATSSGTVTFPTGETLTVNGGACSDKRKASIFCQT